MKIMKGREGRYKEEDKGMRLLFPGIAFLTPPASFRKSEL
jgi:hypothetical protein